MKSVYNYIDEAILSKGGIQLPDLETFCDYFGLKKNSEIKLEGDTLHLDYATLNAKDIDAGRACEDLGIKKIQLDSDSGGSIHLGGNWNPKTRIEIVQGGKKYGRSYIHLNTAAGLNTYSNMTFNAGAIEIPYKSYGHGWGTYKNCEFKTETLKFDFNRTGTPDNTFPNCIFDTKNLKWVSVELKDTNPFFLQMQSALFPVTIGDTTYNNFKELSKLRIAEPKKSDQKDFGMNDEEYAKWEAEYKEFEAFAKKTADWLKSKSKLPIPGVIELGNWLEIAVYAGRATAHPAYSINLSPKIGPESSIQDYKNKASDPDCPTIRCSFL